MHDVLRRRPYFHGTDPLVLIEVRLDPDVLVVQRALGGNLERIGDLHHGIGRPDGPSRLERPRQRCSCGVAFGRPRFDPRQQVAAIDVGQRSVVAEWNIPWCGVPRRHDTLFDDVPDHRTTCVNLVVGRHPERSRSVATMTRETVVLDDPTDATVPGDGRVGADGCARFEDASWSRRGADARHPSIVDRVQRIDEVRRGRLAFRVADAVLIIDGTAIPQCRRGIDDEDFGRDTDTERIPQPRVGGDRPGAGQTVRRTGSTERLDGVGGVRRKPEEPVSACGPLAFDRRESRPVSLGQRTADVVSGNHETSRSGHFREPAFLACQVGERDVADPHAHADLCRMEHLDGGDAHGLLWRSLLGNRRCSEDECGGSGKSNRRHLDLRVEGTPLIDRRSIGSSRTAVRSARRAFGAKRERGAASQPRPAEGSLDRLGVSP